MYEKHPSFESIGENDKIWRYLDFTKFVSLLDRKELFFCRVDQLGDPFEGALSKKDVEEISKAFDRHKHPGTENGSEQYNAFLESKKRGRLDDPKQMRKEIFVNCWHINNEESAAMWKIYGEGDKSIAIQSTFKQLTESFNNYKEGVYIGKVRYIDYESERAKQTSNSLDPLMAKRKSFEYEKELRALVWPLPVDLGTFKPRIFDRYGIYIPVDLDILITKIVVSSLAPPWLNQLVESVSNKYGLGAKIEKSSLSKDPVKAPSRGIPEPVKSLFFEICTEAKSHKPVAFQIAKKLVCRFILTCYEKKVEAQFDGYDFYENLVAEGVDDEIAEELRNQYKFGREFFSACQHPESIPGGRFGSL